MTLDLNNLITTIIVPVLEIAFPIGLIFAITEKLVNIVYSFIRGDKYVKL